MIIEILKDRGFQKGFLLSSRTGINSPFWQKNAHESNEEGFLNRWGNSYQTNIPFPNEEPDWMLEQFFSKHQLATDHALKVGPNTYMFKNEAKRAEKKPDGSFILSIYGHKEFKRARVKNEGWPFLIMTQRFEKERLSEMKSLTMDIDVQLLSVKNHMKEDYDPSLHTLQFTWYLLIGNLNPRSRDYGDFFLFGLPLYDARYEFAPAYEESDQGKSNATYKFIRDIPANSFMDKPLTVGKRVRVKIECLKEIVESFNLAQSRGYMVGSKLSDLQVVSTNLGFQAEGTFDGSVKIRQISIKKEI